MDSSRINNKTHFITRVSMLSVIAFILMFFEIGIPIFPEFLKIDFSNVPVLIGTFAYGPVTGVAIELFKNLLHLVFKNQTAGIGELADFLVSSSFVLAAGYIYKYRKTLIGAIIGLTAGTLAMGIVGSVLNYYVFLPLYQVVLGLPMNTIIGMGTKINSNITDLRTLIVYSILPFNLFKGAVLSVITFLFYKKVSPILKR